MRTSIQAACLSLLLASVLAAPLSAAEPAAPLTAKDVTLKIDNRAEINFYPVPARKAGVEGRAAALCTIGTNGGLYSCKVVEEKPAGCGFGVGIMSLASHMIIAPAARDGSPARGRLFRVELTFKLPNGEKPRATSCK